MEECICKKSSKKSLLQQILDMATRAGEILLRNGAEIPRVEETIQRICRSYGITRVSQFVLSNGIFLTARDENEELYAEVKAIPMGGSHLGIICAVNELSREIEAGRVTFEEANRRLDEIEKMPKEKDLVRIFGTGIGSGCFVYLVGGNLKEFLFTILSSLIVIAFMVAIEDCNFTKVLTNIMGGAIATLMAIFYRDVFNIQMDYSLVIVGTIFQLFPGVAFTNGIRDIAESDFITGAVRLLDALFVFIYMACGVGIVLSLFHGLSGRL